MTTLSEAASASMLAAFGVPFAPFATAASVDEAAAAANSIGFPVVVKLCGPAIAHKSERGLVRLGLADEAAVRAAASDLLTAARPGDGPVELLVAAMVHGRRELIAGVHRDPNFGPTVMVGAGGVFAEVVRDVAFGLLPITPLDAEDMLEELRFRSLLEECRGEAEADRQELVALLLALASLADAHPEVLAVDVNPIVLTADGRPVAVDALVEVE